MNTNDISKVIDKVKKLLALAGSANEHEAALAAERAQAILAQHNLSLDEVEAVRDGDNEIFEDNETKTNSYPWRRQLANSVAKLYFCKYFYRTVRSHRGNARSGHDLHSFIGAKHNIEIAKVMFAYLQETVDRLAKKEAANYPDARGAFITSFTNSCVARLCYRIKLRIEAAKKGEIQGEGGNNLPALASLYDRTDARLSQYFTDHYPNIKTEKSRAQVTNLAGMMAGRAAGDRIGLDRQVGAGAKLKLN